ncbi:uncharacterized protein N7515_001196 [Penicillium bovifimosum]|uniref:Uncharacterized protein n=1 Tax=Penicillium bovifimosum TaxID=126998 RepID=A0A9W9HGT0_9EURO|nr:uncharacterized protein N7515_001196 [Penicillium bovifimosum]KAJ5146632.1 hypothetical protein N7515_001196 [Penicillium bovifimosum]
MLEDLPNELLENIAEWVRIPYFSPMEPERIADSLVTPLALRSLSHASSKLYHALVPRIYRVVVFRAASEWALNVLNVDDFFNHHSKSASHLLHTRHLKFDAPIHLTRFNRCAAFNIFRAVGLAADPFSTIGTPDGAKAHQQFLEDIEDQLRLAFAHLSPGLLRSFTWRLGTCLPAGVLDREGYLIQHQENLIQLSLVTDGSCPHAADHLGGLCQLSSLEVIEWEGIQHSTEIGLLQKCISRNQRRLRTLSIAFSASAGRPDFSRQVLGLQGSTLVTTTRVAGPAPTFLPSLTCLTLSKAYLQKSTQPSALSTFAGLRSLKLRDCVNSCELLEALSRLQNKLQLQLFELCCDNQALGPNKASLGPVVAFLLSLQDLQHLYLKLSDFAHTHQIEAVIRHHSRTLETFVFHEKQLAPIDNERLWWGTRDFCSSWIFDKAELRHLNRLSALALCANTSSVRASLEPGAKGSHLRVLHIRLTGVDHLHRDIQLEVISQIRAEDRDERCPCGCWNGLARRASLSDRDFDFASLWEEQSIESPRTGPSDGSDASEAFGSDLAEIKEVMDFADWAFGPTGLPRLEVLAFGDFAYDERYRKQRFLARRKRSVRLRLSDQSPQISKHYGWFFCIGDMNDPSLWSNVGLDGSRFLSACPDGGPMESPDDW